MSEKASRRAQTETGQKACRSEEVLEVDQSWSKQKQLKKCEDNKKRRIGMCANMTKRNGDICLRDSVYPGPAGNSRINTHSFQFPLRLVSVPTTSLKVSL